MVLTGRYTHALGENSLFQPGIYVSYHITCIHIYCSRILHYYFTACVRTIILCAHTCMQWPMQSQRTSYRAAPVSCGEPMCHTHTLKFFLSDNMIFFFLTLPFQAFRPVVRDLPLLPRHSGHQRRWWRVYAPIYTRLNVHFT